MTDGEAGDDHREALARMVRERQLVLLGACLASDKARGKVGRTDWSSDRIGAAANDVTESRINLQCLFTDLGIGDWDGTGHPLEKLAEHVRLDARLTEVTADLARAFARAEHSHGFTAAEKSACVERVGELIDRAAVVRRTRLEKGSAT